MVVKFRHVYYIFCDGLCGLVTSQMVHFPADVPTRIWRDLFSESHVGKAYPPPGANCVSQRGRLNVRHSIFVTYIFSKIRAYSQYRATVRELSQLSDYELAELGILHFKIAVITRQAVFA